jgi:hypothetical protein
MSVRQMAESTALRPIAGTLAAAFPVYRCIGSAFYRTGAGHSSRRPVEPGRKRVLSSCRGGRNPLMVGYGHTNGSLRRLSLPHCDHQPRCAAVLPVHIEFTRCRRTPNLSRRHRDRQAQERWGGHTRHPAGRRTPATQGPQQPAEVSHQPDRQKERQMRGRRPEADPRFTFHASRFDKLTVPSQVERHFTVLGSGPSTTQMVADRSPQ